MNKEIEILKMLAMRGAMHEYIEVTTSKLGAMMKVSQQTASNRILTLVKNGLAERKLGIRNQQIKITKKGINKLRREFADYQMIFSPKESISIQGIVSTGLGEGQYYVTQDGYSRQFEKKLGFKPYKGTLNITAEEVEIQKLASVSSGSFITINGFKAGGRSFGKVKCLLASIRDVKCAIVIPKRSHHSDVIEVLAKLQLRRSLNLTDGDTVELVVSI